MLRPFAHVRGINVPIRTGTDHSYALTDFQIRLHSIHECRKPTPEMADTHIQRVMAPWAAATEEALGRTLAAIPTDVPSLIALAKEGVGPDGPHGPGGKPSSSSPSSPFGDGSCAPWFHEHREGLERALMFAEHEAVDHPVGMMFVVSSASDDPVAAFIKLADDPASWPPLMRSEAANPNVPRYYVLLHDAREGGGKEELETKVQHLRATFGATSVSGIVINSGGG